MTRYRLWQMLGALGAASFLLSTSGLALSPFLQTIADDLQTTIAAVASLLSFLAIAWGLISPIVGAASDRFGRRPILVTAVFTMGCAQFGLSSATSYTAAILWMIMAGLSGGSFTSTVYATVSDHIPSQQRGTALGWVMTGQSLSMVAGVPLLAILGGFTGWRGALMTYGIVTAMMAFLVYLAVPGDPPKKTDVNGITTPRTPLRALLRANIMFLLSASTMERICFTLVAVYMALYLQTSYGVSLSQVAFGLSLVALGTVSGNMLGGYIADRVTARILLFAGAMLISALLVLPLLLWQPGLLISVELGFSYAFTTSLGRPALMASLSEVPSEVRGAVMGINVTAASIGWLTAAVVGGWLVTHVGFAAIASLCTLAGLCGAGFATMHWRWQQRVAVSI